VLRCDSAGARSGRDVGAVLDGARSWSGGPWGIRRIKRIKRIKRIRRIRRIKRIRRRTETPSGAWVLGVVF
jgi:hypothetical protein